MGLYCLSHEPQRCFAEVYRRDRLQDLIPACFGIRQIADNVIEVIRSVAEMADAGRTEFAVDEQILQRLVVVGQPFGQRGGPRLSAPVHWICKGNRCGVSRRQNAVVPAGRRPGFRGRRQHIAAVRRQQDAVFGQRGDCRPDFLFPAGDRMLWPSRRQTQHDGKRTAAARFSAHPAGNTGSGRCPGTFRQTGTTLGPIRRRTDPHR